MASLKDLRDHINSVKATQKITKAMQLVAAAKLRRAEEAVEAAQPYAERMQEILSRISVNLSENDRSPLMRGTGRDNVHLVVVCTSDRGLCGGFNVQIVRRARQFMRARLKEGKQLKILLVGKKGADMLKREFGSYFVNSPDLSKYKNVNFEEARTVTADILGRYARGEFDICTLFYSKFLSVMSQEPQAQQLIPYRQAEAVDGDEKQQQNFVAKGGDLTNITAEKQKKDIYYEYEPDAADILIDLIPRYLIARIFQILLENAAGEMGAKMTAMDNATRNAGEMINKLSISYNRRRQARITTELIEIIAGAEAL